MSAQLVAQQYSARPCVLGASTVEEQAPRISRELGLWRRSSRTYYGRKENNGTEYTSMMYHAVNRSMYNSGCSPTLVMDAVYQTLQRTARRKHSLKRLTVSMRCVMFVSETVPKRQYGQKSNANEDDHDCEQEKTMQVLQALASTEGVAT
ncbi:hypothetical protein T09_14766 [Trichinella sp. T9]|nr:hypothetical protein T09_14766 [Trichinella sp. T9]